MTAITTHPDRWTYLGGSDAGPILGVPSFKKPFDVYLEKIGLADPREPSEHMEWGLRLQPAILAEYAARTGATLEPERFVGHDKLKWFGGTPDATVAGKKIGVDAKCVRWASAEWGEPGSDQVPAYILVQCHHYMTLMDYDAWDVAALFSGARMGVYTIRRDKEMSDIILERLADFWERHIVPQIPPEVDGSDAARKLIQRLYPATTREVREATAEEAALLDEAVVADTAFDAAEAKKNELRNRINLAAGDCKGLVWPGGRATVVISKGRAGFDSKALAADHPDLAEKYQRTGAPIRSLRLTSNKAD